MKFEIHRANERGHANHGWLDSHHSFSFANYHNPQRMGVGKLRVVNDDVVAAAGGFGTHPHENIEIVSIPLLGALEHKDSMGNKHVIDTDDVQLMSAGTGITHSEYNASDSEPVNFLQIWVKPDQIDISPRYDQKTFDVSLRQNVWQLVVAPLSHVTADEVVGINQQAYFSLTTLGKHASIDYEQYMQGNLLYVFIIDGEVSTNDITLNKRDAMAIDSQQAIHFEANSDCRLLMIEIPPEA